MRKEVELQLLPSETENDAVILAQAARACHLPVQKITQLVPLRRSIDARGKQPIVRLKVAIYAGEFFTGEPALLDSFQMVDDRPQVLIIGAGPAGYFAALQLIELGLKPIVLDRGKDVRERRRDLKAIQQFGQVHPDSNYCFGEGGAGTYSDGKLYTRSKKRGDIRRVLEIFVAHGAVEDILVDAHPHIGTNKLPKIIQAMRETLLEIGGEVLFDTRVDRLIRQGNEIKGVITADGTRIDGLGVILATGHSARDVFELLHQQQILIEAKPFALGVRVEHAQSFIDQIQYHRSERPDYLPAAAYSLVAQTKIGGIERGVFSFCMCPGGFIVPAATAPGEVVVNGMSPSRRDSKYANSGIVVAIQPQDWLPYTHPNETALGALRFQQAVEQQACLLAGNTQQAPAQRLADFVRGKVSSTLLPTSYQPGLISTAMDEVLPAFVAKALREGFQAFGKKMQGFVSNEAQIVGVESRTSSPVRIPRDSQTCEHPQVKRLFPCGEGAGYAGGIMSAAMDGERVAKAFAQLYPLR
ncbi:MAG: FAD-binding protein [Saprospiraceae bacterium]|nr:FAD-binding protein [Saprospiraceae bacterium]